MGLKKSFAPGIVAVGLGLSSSAFAAGTLTPSGGSGLPMEIREHHVDVVLNNGFSRTEVRQVFHNAEGVAVDAIYEFPVPKDAALSEMTIQVGERTLHGEVLGADEARAVYEAERASGSTAGLATQNGYQTFQFEVSNVPAGGDAEMTFVYYEKLAMDASVGRYLYPLEDGNTRSAAETSFWTRNEQVTGSFTFDLELKSAIPVEEVRMPGISGYATEQLGEGHYRVHVESAEADLGTDVVFYYRLPENTPGRIEMVPFRKEGSGPGTFMMILTPGIDLAPLTQGVDYLFVLDVSSSMDTKMHTQVAAVREALGRLSDGDRFRIVAFSDVATEVTPGFVAPEPASIDAALRAVEALPRGGTNLYEGLTRGLADCDDGRVAAVVLVTDGVANQGVVDPIAFDARMRETDVRVFGLLMGNNANWPLMEIITGASGGFYQSVSNQDDVLGQILLARGKMTHESLHQATLSPSGVEVFDTTDLSIGKVYRGQQLVVLGRYATGGQATVRLDARISGADRTYGSSFAFPEVDGENPELERLWALEMIHAIERRRMLGLVPPEEAAASVRALGIEYQLVTDETSMLVVDDAVFEALGIDRLNADRTALEHAAQVARSGQPPQDYRVDGTAPAFPGSSPSAGSGGYSDDDDYGGALDVTTSLTGIALGLWLWISRRRRVAHA